jgi:hypothetical protein
MKRVVHGASFDRASCQGTFVADVNNTDQGCFTGVNGNGEVMHHKPVKFPKMMTNHASIIDTGSACFPIVTRN